MAGHTKDLTVGGPMRQIVLFTLPLLVGNVFQQLYSMVDMIIVGQTISTDAVAAIGATGSMAFLVIGLSFGLTSGFSVVTAQCFGAGDEEGVRRSVASSAVLTLLLSVVVTGASVCSAEPLLRLLDTPGDILGDSHRYVYILYAGTVATMFFNLSAGILRALGDSVTPLLFLVVACVANIVLDYVFIVDFGMGVAGAAWATIAAQALSAALSLAYSLGRFPILRLRRRDWRVSWPRVRRQLATGLSMGGHMAIVAVSVMFLQAAINGFGTDTVKAFSAAMRIDQLATQPMFSIGVAVATFTAQNYGAGKIRRIREGAFRASLLCVAMSFAGCLLMVLSGGWFLELFGIGENEPGVVLRAREYLNTVSALYFLLGLLFVFRNALQGMGRNVVPLLAAGTEIVLRLFTAPLFAGWWGASGICYVNPLCWAVAVAVLLTGYGLAIRRAGAGGAAAEPEYGSVVVSYGGQPTLASATSASARIRLEKRPEGTTKSSVRIL